MHTIYVKGDVVWTFDGNDEAPTFSPSIRITYNGDDHDQRRENGRRAPSACCHYVLINGILSYLTDSSHGLAGQKVALPDIPPEFQDWG